MSSFEEIYDSLNDEQRAAVDHIEGPLLVIAGPGTGKTHLLSARIANILDKTDSSPANILALTFTDKAAQNMKQRLLKMIGPEARKVMVKTFHGFGVELINSHPEYFWNEAELRPAPKAVELEIIEQLLTQRPHDDPYALTFGGAYTKLNDIRQQISRAKKAGLTAGKLKLVCQLNLEYLQQLQRDWGQVLNQQMSTGLINEFEQLLDNLPDEIERDTAPIQPISEVFTASVKRAIEEAKELDKTKPLTTWRNQWAEGRAGQRQFKDIRRSEKMIALAEIYQQFQDAMHSRRYYDFDDMILEVISALEQEPSFRAEVQERFNYILIDEFQDTNDAQFRLSYLVANHPAQSGRPNIMAVGDDDQAIYRFQGAELSNVDNFSQSFDDTVELVLTDNYRSHQSVIDAAQHTVELIDHRLVDLRVSLDKSLTQANSEIEKGQIEHILYSTEAGQLTGVVERVKAVFEAGESVAVLASKHRPLEQIADIFHRQNLPIRYSRRSDVLTQPVIEAVVDIAELIVAIGQGKAELVNQQLVEVLGRPMFELEPKQLWQFALQQRQVRNHDWLSAATESDHPPLAAVAGWLLLLSSIANEESAAVLIEHILGLRVSAEFKSPLRDYYLDQSKATYVESLSAIQKLRSLVVDFTDDHNPYLVDFARFIRLNQEHSVTIADESAFVTEETAVELMTVYKAKGLEFDHVFIIDAVESNWRPRSSRFRPPANLESMRPYGDDADDYARLMYVAMTRAKSSLTVTSYSTDEHGRDVLATPLVQQLPSVETETMADNVEVAERVLRWPEPPLQTRRQLLRPLLENYQLSITHLLNFLDVTRQGPQLFVERNLLRLPTVKTASLVYGTAVHTALEKAQRDYNQDRLDPSAVYEIFERSLISQQLPTHEEARCLSQGQELIQQLFEQQRLQLTKGDQPERTISNVQLGSGAVISGKLDLLRSSEDELRIIDYKTGKGLVKLETTSKGYTGIKALKHRLQLTFYALLVREAGLVDGGQQVVGQMIYLEAEDERSHTVSLMPTDEQIDQLETLINVVWQKIMNLDWPSVDDYDHDQFGIAQFIEDLTDEDG